MEPAPDPKQMGLFQQKTNTGLSEYCFTPFLI